MIKIKTLNQISTIIYNHLPQDKYLVSPDVENPDAILVRSASCHDIKFNDNLLAIARAGVGVNNIPIPACHGARGRGVQYAGRERQRRKGAGARFHVLCFAEHPPGHGVGADIEGKG